MKVKIDTLLRQRPHSKITLGKISKVHDLNISNKCNPNQMEIKWTELGVVQITQAERLSTWHKLMESTFTIVRPVPPNWLHSALKWSSSPAQGKALESTTTLARFIDQNSHISDDRSHVCHNTKATKSMSR